MPRKNLADVLLELERFDEATTEYGEALRLKPNDAETHNNLGLAFAQAGDLVKGMEAFRRAAQLDPKYPDALKERMFSATCDVHETLKWLFDLPILWPAKLA